MSRQKKNLKQRLYPIFTLCALLAMLVCAQGISSGLSLSSFNRLHLDAVVSSYDAVGGDLANKINRALRLGKPLENFIGMEKLLVQGKQTSQKLNNLSILAQDGKPLYSLREQPTIDLTATAAPRQNNSIYRQHGQHHHLLFPLQNRSENLQGYLCLSFDSDQLDSKQSQIIHSSLTVLGFTTLIASLLLVLGFYFIFNHRALRRRRIIYLFIFAVLGGAQLTYSLYNITLFQQHYVEITNTKAITIAQLLKRDVNFLLERGLKLDTLYKIDNQMAQTVDRVAEIATLDIIDNHAATLYHAGSTQTQATRLISYLPVSKHGSQVGQIKIVLNPKVIQANTLEIALDSLTVVALSLLFIIELMIFLFATLLAPLVRQKHHEQQLDDQDALIRPATFIYIYAASLCYSFIPLYMQQLYHPIAGLSREVVLGLPLTMEMLGGGLALIPVGHWIDRKGWHQPFICGSIISIAAAILSGMVSDPVSFIGARTLMGIGYGMVWMSAQGFVLLNTRPNHRARGISNVVAGIFSGIICGNAVGAMLAQHLGFRPVFVVAAALMVLSLAFTLLFMRHSFKAPLQTLNQSHTNEQPEQKRLGLLHLLTDPQALLLFGCSLLPYSVGMVGLLYYVSPIYLKQLGTSQSTIGRVIMLFGLCMIFIAPRISHFADHLTDKRPLVIIGGLLGGISLLLFEVSESFWTVPIAVTLLGLSVSVSAASRNLLTIGLPITQTLGTTRVMGAYRSIDKMGQALGPLIPALLLSYMEIPSAMATMGIAYLILTALLMWGLKRQGEQQDV